MTDPNPQPDDGIEWLHSSGGDWEPCTILAAPDTEGNVAYTVDGRHYVSLRNRFTPAPDDLEQTIMTALVGLGWVTFNARYEPSIREGVARIAYTIRELYPNLIGAAAYGTIATITQDVGGDDPVTITVNDITPTRKATELAVGARVALNVIKQP